MSASSHIHAAARRPEGRRRRRQGHGALRAPPAIATAAAVLLLSLQLHGAAGAGVSSWASLRDSMWSGLSQASEQAAQAAEATAKGAQKLGTAAAGAATATLETARTAGGELGAVAAEAAGATLRGAKKAGALTSGESQPCRGRALLLLAPETTTPALYFVRVMCANHTHPAACWGGCCCGWVGAVGPLWLWRDADALQHTYASAATYCDEDADDPAAQAPAPGAASRKKLCGAASKVKIFASAVQDKTSRVASAAVLTLLPRTLPAGASAAAIILLLRAPVGLAPRPSAGGVRRACGQAFARWRGWERMLVARASLFITLESYASLRSPDTGFCRTLVPRPGRTISDHGNRCSQAGSIYAQLPKDEEIAGIARKLQEKTSASAEYAACLALPPCIPVMLSPVCEIPVPWRMALAVAADGFTHDPHVRGSL